ncbi:MAG: preprotein translocase subunit SecY [Clostridiales bacterium]|nr:preprotein translocase subunit SecY [Clostridiales bacterium]
MFQVFRNAWKVADLRQKLLYTLFIIVIFRLGSSIFVPFLNNDAIQALLGEGTLMNYIDRMTGGSLGRGTILAMSITPYINASIIIQLLTVAIPPLERLAKEGEEGRKKINKITKYTALGIALLQSTIFYFALRKGGPTEDSTGRQAILRYGDIYDTSSDKFSIILSAIVIILCFTAGASVIIWLGDRINEKGIGNGISMILFAGIVARIPEQISNLVKQAKVDTKNAILVPIIMVIFVLMIAFVIFMTNSERRIPVQYAKRVVGRKMYGGQSTHIPIKVAMAGVMPIIFASSIMTLPQTLTSIFGIPDEGTFWRSVYNLFLSTSSVYAILYFLLIIGFNYFYIAIQYNPVQIANDLKKNNGAIPGYRPGKPTSDFISNSLSKITLIGAIFLGIIAVFPILFSKFSGISGLSLGGTSLLIVVGVALETVRTMESQMMMRHHKGFLE